MILRALLILVAILAALPARADTLADMVAKLGAGGFSDRDEAVNALGSLGDGRAVPALAALQDGRLYLTPDKQVVIGDPAGAGLALKDPVTLADRGAGPADLEKIRINNRVRTSLDAALAKLKLFSPDPDQRIAAAQDATKHPSAETAGLLAKATAAEQDPRVAAVLRFSLSAAQLNAGTSEQRIAALVALAGSVDPDIRALVGQLAAAPDTEPKVRQAAQATLASIERRLQLIDLGVNLFQGLSLGSVLLLAAIGLAITFGVMGVINMAHGEMMMLGAYTTFVVQQAFRAYLPPAWIDAYLVAAIPAAFLVAGAVGVAIERGVIRFLYRRRLETLLATWGLSLMLQQAVRTIFGAPNKEVANPSWMTGGFEVMGGFTVTWNRLWIIAFGALVMALLVLILRRTALGLHMRAVTQNREMAAAMGIPTARIDALTFGLGSGVAGMAGVALSQIGNVSPNLGTLYIVDSFMVVVFGGVGNLAGTLMGALGLGVVNKLLEPFAGAVLGKIAVLVAIILFIQVRPRGLFALKGRAAEL